MKDYKINEHLMAVAEVLADIRYGLERGVYPANEEVANVVRGLDDAAADALDALADVLDERANRVQEIDEMLERLVAERHELTS